ncbi:6621f087-f0aa-427e-8276-eab1f106128d [Sclerotinia trifoliorum]|uniref:6621f087-f0aa-427e-8276-eab1f106128d n=1 Tax=Sclerotinia trifoliorum TaxID=28548 RepID=A0A8H2ZPZ6_9HELO|nr:6621f087-f0aa-427e-8276-eab1f106128d [Sclerotinia trifoliorum]
MGLVDYSDSDDSDVPETTAPKQSSSTSTTNKPAFQKVVDRSNPGKIRVSLPQTSKDDTKIDEPPTKRAKTGGGAFSGFNSFLPAPKKTGQSTNATLGGGNAARKGGLGAGVSLKTGATPAFNREPEPAKEYTGEPAGEEEAGTESGINLPPPSSLVDEQKPADEVKLVGKPLMFKPLSVARKPAKKKLQKSDLRTSTPTSTLTPQISTPATPQNSGKATPKPKVSLFSLEVESANTTPITTSKGEYKPMLYQPISDQEPTYEEYTPTTTHTLPFVPTPPVNPHNTESLSSIADTLHLSAAERRQLFGRQKGGSGPQAATKIINFNTDQEYAHNEELRASGEQVVHNPVRAIAPGKHSLKQLVGAAQSQKEALEESFATGRNNRKEAGSKYGW